MIDKQNVVVIIPARGGSQRLPRKNIYPIWDKPMIYWAIQAALQSRYIDWVYVSTEDQEIADISLECGAWVIIRPKELADHQTFKQDVIVHGVESFRGRPDVNPDIVISLQANSPEVNPDDLDAALEKFIEYDRDELFSVNSKLIQNAAFRIMKREYVYQKSLSTKCGVFITDYIDVHDEDDVKHLEYMEREKKS